MGSRRPSASRRRKRDRAHSDDDTGALGSSESLLLLEQPRQRPSRSRRSALSVSSPARKAKFATTFCLVNRITVTSASLLSLYAGGPSASSNAPTGTVLSPCFCAHFARRVEVGLVGELRHPHLVARVLVLGRRRVELAEQLAERVGRACGRTRPRPACCPRAARRCSTSAARAAGRWRRGSCTAPAACRPACRRRTGSAGSGGVSARARAERQRRRVSWCVHEWCGWRATGEASDRPALLGGSTPPSGARCSTRRSPSLHRGRDGLAIFAARLAMSACSAAKSFGSAFAQTRCASFR